MRQRLRMALLLALIGISVDPTAAERPTKEETAIPLNLVDASSQVRSPKRPSGWRKLNPLRPLRGLGEKAADGAIWLSSLGIVKSIPRRKTSEDFVRPTN